MEASFALLARALNERLSQQRASSDAMVRPSETEIDDARREQRRQSA